MDMKKFCIPIAFWSWAATSWLAKTQRNIYFHLEKTKRGPKVLLYCCAEFLIYIELHEIE